MTFSLIVFPSDFQVYRAAYCTILERLLRISSGKWCGRYVMPLSKEVRRLERAWQNETAWPKRLDWIEIDNIRGWQGQRIKFPFPIVAISGENGTGKSTIIQACSPTKTQP